MASSVLDASSASSTPPTDSREQEREAWFRCEVQPYEPGLRRYLGAQFRSLSDAIDDLVQETYLRILRTYERGPVDSPRGLLFTIARNVARDLLRRRGAGGAYFAITESDELRVLPDDDVIEPSESASRSQEYGLLAAAIAELPPRCREVLVLRKFEHLSQREISQRLCISEHTVEAQLTKALHRCTAFFAKHGLP